MRVTSKGLTVWDLETDKFDHSQLAANLDLINTLLGSPSTSFETLATLPVSGNFAGRLVMLSASDGGFQPWTAVRYDGSAWRAVGPFEVQPAVPSTGNYAGRIVILSASSGGFNAYDVIRYDGSTWNIVGGWAAINNGGGALNIRGLQQAGDVYVNDSARGFVLVDRSSGQKRRVFLSGGSLATEIVT